MIHIEQNQAIPENENIFVASQTGDYEDNALIDFYGHEDPEKILGAFAAQYVKYGGLVYKFNDPKELGAEILKLEPESTHSAASFVRMQNELLAQFNQGSLEPESLQQVIEDEKEMIEEKASETEIEEPTEETTEEDFTQEERIIDVIPEEDNIIENPVLEESNTEIIKEEILPAEDIIEKQIIPIENTETSLPEEIISRAKGRNFNRLKIKRRI